MKKLKRSARLVEMTQYLLSRPHTVIPLTTFAERYGAAKSSISEDLAIIKEVFKKVVRRTAYTGWSSRGSKMDS